MNAVAVAVVRMTERFNKFFYGFLSACLLMIIFVSCADEFYFGKSKEDLAPTTNLILLLITPFHIILLFFGVIFECHIAGSKPKKS